jgi:hypothetical protein
MLFQNSSFETGSTFHHKHTPCAGPAHIDLAPLKKHKKRKNFQPPSRTSRTSSILKSFCRYSRAENFYMRLPGQRHLLLCFRKLPRFGGNFDAEKSK